MTDRYNTPEKGASDWHNPLNENFTKLDKHVEIRDTDASRDNYDPKSGAKFLATDTGAVYIGDGSNWSQIGTISSSTSGSSGETSDGTVVAAPGDVQSVIDQYNTGFDWGPQPMQRIKLVSGEVYRPSAGWRIRSGTILDCNGAVIRPQGDFDMISLERSALVYKPYINCSDVTGYSSAAIVIQVADSGKAGTPNPAHIYDCHVFNNEGKGVGVRFLGDETPVSMQRCTGKIHNFDRGLEFRSRGSGTGSQAGWCNGNQFFGNINGARVPIYLISENGAPVGGNTVFGQVQASEKTEWVIRQEDGPTDSTPIRGNTYIIRAWDTRQIENRFKSSSKRDPPRAPIWYIGRGKQEGNSMWSMVEGFSNQFILNRSTVGRNTNGIFTGSGISPARGAVNRTHSNTYHSNNAQYHPDS